MLRVENDITMINPWWQHCYMTDRLYFYKCICETPSEKIEMYKEKMNSTVYILYIMCEKIIKKLCIFNMCCLFFSYIHMQHKYIFFHHRDGGKDWFTFW